MVTFSTEVIEEKYIPLIPNQRTGPSVCIGNSAAVLKTLLQARFSSSGDGFLFLNNGTVSWDKKE